MTWIVERIRLENNMFPPQSERERETVSKRDVSPLVFSFFFIIIWLGERERERALFPPANGATA